MGKPPEPVRRDGYGYTTIRHGSSDERDDGDAHSASSGCSRNVGLLACGRQTGCDIYWVEEEAADLACVKEGSSDYKVDVGWKIGWGVGSWIAAAIYLVCSISETV